MALGIAILHIRFITKCLPAYKSLSAGGAAHLLAVGAAMMKMQPVGLCILATVFLSCALSLAAGNDELGSLVGPKAGEKTLEKKKPPPNVPGPKLTLGNLDFLPLVGIREFEEITKKLAAYNPDKGRKRQAQLARNKKNPLLGPQSPPQNKDRFIPDHEMKNRRRGSNLD